MHQGALNFVVPAKGKKDIQISRASKLHSENQLFGVFFFAFFVFFEIKKKWNYVKMFRLTVLNKHL